MAILVNKDEILESIKEIRGEMNDVVEALTEYESAINNGDMASAEKAYHKIDEHIGGGQYTKHIQFTPPEYMEFEDEE
jgi:hypothetical protein